MRDGLFLLRGLSSFLDVLLRRGTLFFGCHWQRYFARHAVAGLRKPCRAFFANTGREQFSQFAYFHTTTLQSAGELFVGKVNSIGSGKTELAPKGKKQCE